MSISLIDKDSIEAFKKKWAGKNYARIVNTETRDKTPIENLLMTLLNVNGICPATDFSDVIVDKWPNVEMRISLYYVDFDEYVNTLQKLNKAYVEVCDECTDQHTPFITFSYAPKRMATGIMVCPYLHVEASNIGKLQAAAVLLLEAIKRVFKVGPCTVNLEIVRCENTRIEKT